MKNKITLIHANQDCFRYELIHRSFIAHGKATVWDGRIDVRYTPNAVDGEYSMELLGCSIQAKSMKDLFETVSRYCLRASIVLAGGSSCLPQDPGSVPNRLMVDEVKDLSHVLVKEMRLLEEENERLRQRLEILESGSKA